MSTRLDHIGSKLIGSVTLSIGGDIVPRYYCSECHNGTDTQPEICGAEILQYNENKAEQYYMENLIQHNNYKDWESAKTNLCSPANIGEDQEQHYTSLLDSCFWETDQTFEDYISEVHDCNDRSICHSTEFELKKQPGVVIDKHCGDYLRLWEELASDKT